MADFFAELKRRQIYRVGAAYVVVAWALTQGVAVLAQVFSLPSWIAQTAIVLLALGFPLALITAWMIESKPHQAVASAVRSKPTIVDWSLFGALACVMLLIGYQQLVPASGGTTPLAEANTGGSASLDPAGAISLAVLPFTNLSDDRSQEFFSDGMTEEITSALAKVAGLNVVARTSAFEFKGQNRDIRAIGRTLSATHLIEGSVRKAGDRLRITAQLVRSDTGSHLWTESYDRELTDIFAIQEEIARAIASALRTPLGLAQGENLVSGRTEDLNSYEEFLRARALYRARDLFGAIAVLERLTARDPNYARAWGLLAEAYVYTPDDGNVLFEKVERAAQQALRLDPRNALAYSALADIESFRGHWAVGEDGFRRALALDPTEPDVLHRYSTRLGVSGRITEALALREKLNSLEPFVPLYNVNTARFLVSKGDTAPAIAILQEVPADTPVSYNRGVALARAHAIEGRYEEAATALLMIVPRDQADRRSIEDAARLIRQAPDKAGPADRLPRLPGSLNFAYAYVGALDRALEIAELGTEPNGAFTASLDILWQAEAAPLRKTARFRTFVRDAGLVDYWRERGWPEFCKPVGADDFECS